MFNLRYLMSKMRELADFQPKITDFKHFITRILSFSM